MRIAICGGVYSNPYSLRAFVDDAHARGAERLYCLGDFGGYGAEPNAIRPLLADNDIICIAGNYDVAIAAAADDCGCGYSDPRDQQYAQVMYDYTVAHTSRDFAGWMAELPTERRDHIGGLDVHFVHGSPLGLNDFWWESLSDDAHRSKVRESGADVVVATHSGLPWSRRFDDVLVVNVGVIGRPANDGTTDVSYAIIELLEGVATAEIVPLRYDWHAQVRSMRAAGLPEAFVRTNKVGWWATCLQVMPLVERSAGRYHVYDSSVESMLAAAGVAGPWHDDDPSLPVRSLLGSPLLPARIRIADGISDHAHLVAAASAVRINEILSVGDSRTGGPVAELTLGPRGWHRSPDHLDEDPLRDVLHPAASVLPRDVGGAVRSVVHAVLLDLQAAGALAPPRYCVS